MWDICTEPGSAFAWEIGAAVPNQVWFEGNAVRVGLPVPPSELRAVVGHSI